MVCKKNKTKLADLIEFSTNKIRNLSLLDFAITKVCILSFGILFGLIFFDFFKKNKIFVGFTAIVSYIYLIIKIFLKKE